MAQHAGYSRWVYNWGLATTIRLYQEGIKIKTTQPSKTCSNCQDIKQDLTLSDRWFICNNCGVFLPRDWNASINLASYADGLSVKACGVVNADVATLETGSKECLI